MALKSRLLKKYNGKVREVYLATSADRVVVDENGNTLDAKLQEIESSVSKDSNPIGAVIIWFGDVALPDGYVSLDGQELSRTDYAELFALYGESYGVGDGSTTFAIPNQNASSDPDIVDDTGYKYILKTLP